MRSRLLLAALLATTWIGTTTSTAQAGSDRTTASIQARRKPVKKPVKKKTVSPKRRARAVNVQPQRRMPILPERGREPVGNSAPAGETELERRLQARLDELLGTRWIKTGINGVHVRDVKTGKVLYAYGDDRQLNVASNMKLVATAAAFDTLGSDFAWETRLEGSEPDAAGVINGDLRLRGAFDPTLGVKAITELAQGLADRGVTRVSGDVVVMPGDRDTVASPRVAIDIVAGPAEGDLPAVTLTPDGALFVVETTAETTRKQKKPRAEVSARWVAGATPDADRFVITIAGKLKPNERLRSVKYVPRGALFTAHVLRAELLVRGVKVDGGVRTEVDHALPTTVLTTHRSVPLRVLAAKINKPSDNYLADRLTMALGGTKRESDPTMDGGVEAMGEWLGKIGVRTGFRLENGSGLSYTAHMSAKQVVDVLLAGAAHEGTGEDFLHSLSVGGVDGTLRSRFSGRPSRTKVRGKTGTLTGVAALSGFVEIAPDQKVCFSILTNNFNNRRKLSIRAAQADLVDAMYGYLEARAGRARQMPTPLPVVEDAVPENDVPEEPEGAVDPEAEAGEPAPEALTP
jgi:serine-type D-Ala-D-Ala carboxypeptidase/endopeptidase (penicillin-binding protein 4)